MTFRDARLHIAVRPTLEYTLPAAANRVRDALLGDATTLEAVEALQQCLPSESKDHGEDHGKEHDQLKGPPGELKDAEHDEETTSSHEVCLETRCARVCSHIHEYLQDLASHWTSHLTSTHVAIRRAVRRLETERAEAYKVHARYRTSNVEVVDQELRLELTRLRVDLERTLERVRNNPTPSCERTKLLTEASHELREAFAYAYGTMPTKDLLSLKRRFESDVTIVERRIAQDFVARIVKLLKGG